MSSLPTIGIDLKSRKVLFLLAALLVLIVLALGAWFYYANRPVAKVNGQAISKEDFERRVTAQTYFYTKVSPSEEKLKTVKADTLDFFIQMILMEQELKKYGGEITQKKIDDAYAEKAKERGGLSEYEVYLKSTYNMQPEDVKLSVRYDLLKEELQNHDSSAHLFGIWFIKRSPGDKAEKDLTASERAANQQVRTRAEAALARVKSGEDFGKLAKELSEDPISKAKGGDLGIYSHFSSPSSFNRPNQTSTPRVFPSVAVMEEALQTLGEGEANVFDYLTGYGVVKATEVKKGFSYQTIEQFFELEKKKARIEILVKL